MRFSTRTGTAIADILGGVKCLYRNFKWITREKQYKFRSKKIDIALVDSVVSSMETIMQIYLVETESQLEPVTDMNSYILMTHLKQKTAG